MMSSIVIAKSSDWLDIIKQERHVAQQTNTGYVNTPFLVNVRLKSIRYPVAYIGYMSHIATALVSIFVISFSLIQMY